MNVIYPSEKRKFVIEEIVDINSPSILITSKPVGDYLTNSPFKVISHLNLHRFSDNSEFYSCVVLDPEFFYPKSALFKRKYIDLFEFLRKHKFKNISVISAAFSKKMMLDFLRDVGANDFEVRVFPKFDFKVIVLFEQDKLARLKDLVVDKKVLVICKNEYHSSFLYEVFNKTFADEVFVLNVSDFDYRRKVIADFVSNGRLLIVPRKYRWFLRKVSFDRVIFLSFPRSVEEFLYFSSVFRSGEYVFLVSDRDEYKVSRKVMSKKLVLERYIDFLNFLGYRGDRLNYLREFLLSSKFGKNLTSVNLTEEEKVLYNLFYEKYLEYRRGIDIVLGVEGSYVYFEYGKMRGMSREYITKLINDLVSKGVLGYRYFLSDGRIIKKVY